MNSAFNDKVMILGAGPAGLSAAYRMSRHGVAPRVYEKRGMLGGIACTERIDDYLFDMGGHRFFTKNDEVKAIWNEVLGSDFLTRRRLSRIYYKGHFLDYPLKVLSALKGLGIAGAVTVLASYLRWRLHPYPEEDSFEQWVTNRFGKRLFTLFFKSYTEKVWGIPCSEISSVWAAQRIQNLSLKKTLAKMFSLSGKQYRSLIDRFHYPRRGPTMMWEGMARIIREAGGTIARDHEVTALHRQGFRITEVTVSGPAGEFRDFADHYISSMPVTTFLKRLRPLPPRNVLESAESLRYRDFITVCLIVDQREVFPDQWIYIQDPDIRMGRIQNYKNWSPEMVPLPNRTGLGLEYFCSRGDDLWNRSDVDLVDLGKDELEAMGLVDRNKVIKGRVFRVPKAYPLYDRGYDRHLETVQHFVNRIENFQTIGRSGLFRYNNMDHSMISGLTAAENVLNAARRDLWVINDEPEYLEEQIDQ